MVGSTSGINTIHNGVHDSTDSIETSKMDIACISDVDKKVILDIDNQIIDIS
jgi:hypothetical protein